ncbi:glycosyltransferase family A protein [Turicibacter sanguinis]|uniref:glycosyltransferase family A protein n=1 Tax=Turicibacter sanguinis TaxID=154288 RepID=UPI0032EF06C4
MYYLTVVTPTYNRAHTIGRVYESLKIQEFDDFEWLIIDDGSTDNTKEVVEGFIKEQKINIRYYYKENGGRHTALNMAYKLLNSIYVINKDSDDKFSPNALANIRDIWESIPKQDYPRFWCISGRCIDSKTGNMVGRPYPPNINQLKGKKQHRIITKIKGEKSCCRKVEVVKQYPFPEYKDTKFVSENMVWEKINKKYDQYCVNDILRIYYTDSEDGLCKGNMHSSQKQISYYYYSLFYVNECFEQVMYNSKIILSILNISRCGLLSGKTWLDMMRDTHKFYKKILVTLGYPISKLWIILIHNKRVKNNGK